RSRRLGRHRRRRRRGLVGRAVAELDRDLALPAVARDAELNLLAGLRRVEELLELGVLPDLLAVHARDDVALLQARLLGRRVGDDVRDEGARPLGELGQVGAEEAPGVALGRVGLGPGLARGALAA